MPKKSKIPFRNRDHSGWWVFSEVQQWVSTLKEAKQQRFPVWENTRIIRARNRELAYAKAIKLARVGMPSKTTHGEWRFVGLSSLLPIYEALEDGTEILWTDHGSIGDAKLKRLLKPKRDLPVFDDTDRE